MNERYKQQHLYDDIIDLPHHVSSVHPPMSLQDRAAQFSPFAALTGYHESVAEAARFTDEKRELDEHTKAILDERLGIIREHLGTPFEVTVTYFLPDTKKSGGAYLDTTGTVKKINDYKRTLIMDNGLSIPIDDIAAITGSIF